MWSKKLVLPKPVMIECSARAKPPKYSHHLPGSVAHQSRIGAACAIIVSSTHSAMLFRSSASRKPPTRWAPQARWSLRRARKIRLMIQLAALTIILLIILPAWIIYKPPRRLINYFARRFPEVLFHVSTSQKIVALTIDDTPSRYTKDILDILQQNNARATFFVIGGQVRDTEQETMLADIVKQGSELGNHAMHDEPSVQLTTKLLESQIAHVDGIIERAYSQAGRQRSRHWFRPGSGFFSKRILNVVNKAGYDTALGDIFPHDPLVSIWRINAWHVLSSLQPGGVIILHDRRSWTVPLLRYILPLINKRGYRVVGITEALELANN